MVERIENSVNLPGSIYTNSTSFTEFCVESVQKSIDFDQIYRQINQNTGQILDLRDVNNPDFIEKLSQFHEWTPKQERRESKVVKKQQEQNEKLFTAVVRSDIESLATILQTSKHVEINSRTLDNYTALHMAAEGGNPVAIELILTCDDQIDLEARTLGGRTALHIATLVGSLDIVRQLIKRNVNMMARDVEGDTPLHYAARWNRPEIAQVLTENIFDLDIQNNQGQTPIQIARELRNLDVLAILDTSPQPLQSQGPIFIRTYSQSISRLLYKAHAKTVFARDYAIFANRKNWKKPRPSIARVKFQGPRHFQLLDMIGMGSYGMWFKAEHKYTKKIYAIKIMEKEMYKRKGIVHYANTERAILEQMDFPFIIKLRWAFQTKSYLCLVFDYYKNKDLWSALKKEKRFDEQRAKIYFCEALLSIEYLHAKDIAFRDIKPENILVDDNGHLVLTDFGIAKFLNSRKSHTFWGSTTYMSPEVLKKQGHGKTIDCYCLGVMLYEFITGRPPFRHPHRQELFEAIKNAKLKFPDYMSQEAGDLINKLMTKDPKDRLGFNGIQEIKSHPFLSDIKWSDIYYKKIQLPQPLITTRKYSDDDDLSELLDQQVFNDKYFPRWDYYDNRLWKRLLPLLF